jgi:hypothetical protein
MVISRGFFPFAIGAVNDEVEPFAWVPENCSHLVIDDQPGRGVFTTTSKKKMVDFSYFVRGKSAE